MLHRISAIYVVNGKDTGRGVYRRLHLKRVGEGVVSVSLRLPREIKRIMFRLRHGR